MNVQPRKLRFGFTLMEMMIAMTIAVLVISGVLAVFIMSARGVTKTMHADDAIRSTKKFQDHLAREISNAAAAPVIKNVAGSPLQYFNPGVDADGVTRNGKIVYRVNIGTSLSHVQNGGSDVSLGAMSVTIDWPVNSPSSPQVGDYLRMDSPDLNAGLGIQITSVSGTTTLALGLAGSFAQAIADPKVLSVPDKSIVYIQRERAYETIPDPVAPLSAPAKLVWYESTANPTQTVISSNIDPSNLYLFEDKKQTSATGDDFDHQLGWIYSYISGDAGILSSIAGLGRYSYVTNNDSQGAVIARSDALGSLGNVTTTLSGDAALSTTPSTSVSPTSAATTTVSSVPSTTVSSKPTTTTSTTPSTTATSKPTTSAATSIATTKPSTTKNTSTSVKTTSTTKPSTTKPSTTSSIATTSTSTSTSTTSSTTSQSTSSKTTTTISTTTTAPTTTVRATTTIFDG